MYSRQKKSEQSKNKSVVLALNKHNTKMKLESLGDVELKYVSHGDTIELAKLLEEQLSDKGFVAKILFHQLVKPEIDLGDFQKLSDKELEELARAFVKNEDHTFKYFQDTGDFFKDFKKALVIGYEKHIEELRKTFEPIVKSAQESYKRLTENIANIITGLPKIDIPKFQIPFREVEQIKVPPNLDIIREQNAWKRHKDILDVQNALLGIQTEILNEQRSTTKLTKWILGLTILVILLTGVLIVLTLVLVISTFALSFR